MARERQVEAPGSAMGMAAAVDFALKHSPTPAQREAQANASVSSTRSARGAFGPRLGLNYSWSKQERKTDPSTANNLPRQGTYSLGVEVTQPVFQGFRLLSAYQRAALQEDSDKAALRSAELTLVQQVQAQFLACLAAEENIKSEADALTRLNEQLKITRAYHEVGLRPRLDVLQAEVDVSRQENSLIVVTNTRDTARARLNVLLGLPADSNVTYVGDLGYTPFDKNLEQCLALAYTQRPDLFVAEKSVEIAQKDQRIAQSSYYPQIDAYYSISSRGNTPDLQRSGEHGSSQTSWEVGARATWNVFQWGVTYYDDQRAGWQVERMRQAEEELKLEVGYDIKSCLLSLREAEKRISVSEKAVSQAQEAYEAALARYQEQVGTNFDVLDASSNLTRAQATLTSARADYLTALSRLYTAIGEFHPDLLQI